MRQVGELITGEVQCTNFLKHSKEIIEINYDARMYVRNPLKMQKTKNGNYC